MSNNMDVFEAFLFAVIWVAPLIMIRRSNKTCGGEKIAWLLLVIFVSWFAWVFYLLLAPLKSRCQNN
jgi:hypothetical protein